MSHTLVITIMGADQPGLVAKVASCVADHNGNWLESHLVHLGGQFAGVLRVEAPDTDSLAVAIQSLEQEGVRSICQSEQTDDAFDTPTRLVTLDLIGADRPGILRNLSAILSKYAVNIEELATDRRAAPMSGEMLFQGHAVLKIPPTTSLGALRADLERIADDLMIDLLFGEPSSQH